MQKDTRHLTVAREHLQSAYEEITLAQGNPERSIAEAAVARALSHLDLVTRRLEQERSMAGRGELGQEVEQAFAASRQAWQRAHDVANDWSRSALLEEIRQGLTGAIEAVDRAGGSAGAEGIHS
jgi:hypothetical protein